MTTFQIIGVIFMAVCAVGIVYGMSKGNKKDMRCMLLLLALLTTGQAWGYHGTLVGDGSCTNPYTIGDMDDWNMFTNLLNDPVYAPYYCDKHFRLGADLGSESTNPDDRVTTWASKDSRYPFCGTFDGNGHTIWIKYVKDDSSVNPSEDSSHGVALFQYASHGCEIHDLIVRGEIYTNYKYAAALISYISEGSSTNSKYVGIDRCTSYVDILYETYAGDACSGGFVGYSGHYVFLNMNDCLYRGVYRGEVTGVCGMLGYQANNGWAYFENCYVNPTHLYINYSDDNHNFCKFGYDIGEVPCYTCHNSLYENPGFGDEQGEITILDYITPESVASFLGNWVVQAGQPIPVTINMVADHCTLYSGFNAYSCDVRYNANNNSNEAYGKVVDGDKATKWCVYYPYSTHDSWVPISVYFNYDKSFIPKGYILTTGSDVENHPDRLPKEWEFYGWNTSTNNWDLLDHHTSGSLPQKNVADKAFLLKNYESITTDYNKFWLKIDKIEREDEYWNGLFGGGWVINENDFAFELGEIRIFGVLSENDQHDLANCAISGLLPYYEHTGSAITLRYMVTDYDGDELVEGANSHYTKTIIRRYGGQTENVSEVIGSGEYTFTITGHNMFHGTQSTSFVVTDPDLPDPMVWTNDGENTYYYVKMPATGQTTLDLSSDVRPFTESFYVYNDGGPGKYYSPNCDGKLVIHAPEGYVLQVEGYVRSEGYPNDYLVIYDGDDVDDPVLGDLHYGIKDSQNVQLMNTKGRDMLLHFISNDVNNTYGMELLVTPVSATTGHDIDIADVDNGNVTTTLTEDVLINTDIVLNINPNSGYMLQSINAMVGTKVLNVDGGLWYLDDPDTQDDERTTATFIMPSGDVTVMPAFAATNALSVNMPYNIDNPADAMKVFVPEDVTSFKVYNAYGYQGGYSRNTISYMLLVAPDDKILQISGTIDPSDGGAYFEVYDGDNMNNSMGYCDKDNKDIGVLVSSNNQVLLLFVSDDGNCGQGINITVRPLDPDASYTIPTVTATGGTITPNQPTAQVCDNINLQIEPSNGYRLNELKVTQTVNGNNYEVAVNGGLWHDANPTEASFVMPANDVAITPAFTNNFTSGDGGLYINMPISNYSYAPKTVNIPSDVTSFKVYDNGGKDGNYSTYCDGYMVLTAPIGYVLRLSGNVTCQDKGTYNDFLKVYDGDDVDDTPLGNPDGFGNTAGLNFGPLTSSGRSMMLYFHTGNNSMRGLDLTVEVSNEDYPYIITFDGSNAPANCGIAISGYESVSGTHYVAHVNDDIIVNVTRDDNHLLEAISVKDADGNEIALSQGLAWYNGNNTVATFTMPARNITITYEFVEKGNQYVNMPKLNTAQTPMEVTVPEGVTSFKIYDDGGPNANYSDKCNGYILVTAPAGKVLLLTGVVISERYTDFMVPYEGNTDAKPIDYYMYGSHLNGGENIGGLVTFGNQMLVRFYSDYAFNYAGLDLTATVIDPITKYVKGYGSDTDNGPWSFIAAPMKYYAMPENVTNLFLVVNEVPNTASADYDLYRYNQSSEAEWENYKAHKNGFTLNDGQGYLYANRYTRTLQFAGAVNIDNSKDVALAYDASAGLPGWNLVGNPLMANAYVNKPYYVINDIGNDIEPVDNYMTLPVSMCDGIIVCADGEDETVRFSKTQQSRSIDNGSIAMTLSKVGDYQDKAIVSFNEDAKLGKFIFNENNAKLYIPQDDKDYAIVYAKREGEIPVNFKAKTTGKYTISFEGDDMSDVKLVDKFENVTVDLNATPYYTFTASAVDNADRFKLVFSSTGSETGSETFAYQNGDQIVVDGEGELQVFDVLGRHVADYEISGVQIIDAPQTGVYIIRLIGNEKKTQKIVIK